MYQGLYKGHMGGKLPTCNSPRLDLNAIKAAKFHWGPLPLLLEENALHFSWGEAQGREDVGKSLTVGFDGF